MLVDLASVPFAEILHRAAAFRCTGDLQVRCGRIVKTLFLDDGALAFAASNLKADRLGEVLVALGRITPGELTETARLMTEAETRVRFGDALTASGLMGSPEVGQAVVRQVESIVLSLFPLNEGLASLEERPCPIPAEYRVELSVHRLLYEGILSMSDADRIDIGLLRPDRSVQLARTSPFRFRLERCSNEEYAVLEQARKPIALGALIDGGTDAFERWRAVCALLASGVLVGSDAPIEERPIGEATTASALLATTLSRHRVTRSSRVTTTE